MKRSSAYKLGEFIGKLFTSRNYKSHISLHTKLDKIMGELQDIKGQLDTANESLAAINENLPVVDEKLTGIQTDVDYLKKKLEDGANTEEGISQADAKELLASVTTLATGVTDLKDKFANLAKKATDLDNATDSSTGTGETPETPAEPAPGTGVEFI